MVPRSSPVGRLAMLGQLITPPGAAVQIRWSVILPATILTTPKPTKIVASAIEFVGKAGAEGVTAGVPVTSCSSPNDVALPLSTTVTQIRSIRLFGDTGAVGTVSVPAVGLNTRYEPLPPEFGTIAVP